MARRWDSGDWAQVLVVVMAIFCAGIAVGFVVALSLQLTSSR